MYSTSLKKLVNFNFDRINKENDSVTWGTQNSNDGQDKPTGMLLLLFYSAHKSCEFSFDFSSDLLFFISATLTFHFFEILSYL
jgi:hypothetical protein